MTTETMTMTAPTTLELVEHLRLLGKELGFWRNGFGYKDECQQLFGDMDLSGKTMLEVGCGKGLLCLWAKIHGAKHVIALEPLAAGHFDSTKCYKDFATMTKALKLEAIEMLPHTIQDYKGPANYFDVVLSYASLNHLDERSCIDLQQSAKAREVYLAIFRQLRTIMKKGGKLIIVDASSRNLFGDCGLKNPFAPEIEWFKHQPPEFWASLLSQCGLGNPKLSWLTGALIRGRLGIYTVSRIVSYFYNSAFRLEVSAE